jgi:hypothetical protein
MNKIKKFRKFKKSKKTNNKRNHKRRRMTRKLRGGIKELEGIFQEHDNETRPINERINQIVSLSEINSDFPLISNTESMDNIERILEEITKQLQFHESEKQKAARNVSILKARLDYVNNKKKNLLQELNRVPNVGHQERRERWNPDEVRREREEMRMERMRGEERIKRILEDERKRREEEMIKRRLEEAERRRLEIARDEGKLREIESSSSDEVEVFWWKHKGKNYLKSSDNRVYDAKTQERIGIWNEEEDTIEEISESSDDSE